MNLLNAPHEAFIDEGRAIAFVESRLWANGRVCPRCGVVGKSGRLEGESTRPGVWKCYACRKPFTVKVGTAFQSTRWPMQHWLRAIEMVAEGSNSYDIARELEVAPKSAWSMRKRIIKHVLQSQETQMAKQALPQSQVSRSTSGLREALFEEMDALRSGSSNAQRARSIAMMANSILQSVQVEIEYHKYVNADRAKSIQGEKKVVSLGTDINLGGEKAA